MTLDDLEGHYELCFKNMRLSEPTTKFEWRQTDIISDEDVAQWL